MMMIGGAQPKGTDARGRIYYEGSSMSPTPEGIPKAADSVSVMRYDRSSKKTDTVAWLKVPPNVVKVSGTADNRSVSVSNDPFAPRDDWSVFPDGRIVVARSSDYHLEYYPAAGAKRAMPPLKFDRLAFTEAGMWRLRVAKPFLVIGHIHEVPAILPTQFRRQGKWNYDKMWSMLWRRNMV